MRRYIDFDLTKRFPNKYNITPDSIKKFKVLDWPCLKKHCGRNEAIPNGTWYCRLVGCQDVEEKHHNDFDEFWIGFREEDGKVDYSFTSYDGMCGYSFDKFYDSQDIENKWDMNVQVNTIRFLNMLLDEGIVELT